MKNRILVACRLPAEALDYLRGRGLEVEFSPDSVPDSVGSFDAVLIRSNVKANEAFLKKMKRGAILVRLGSGLDNVDLESAKRLGIEVYNTPGSSATSVAEHAMALMLALSRKLVLCDQQVKRGLWPKREYSGCELRGKTLGVIGLGNTGGELARLAQAFGMSVIGYDKYKASVDGVKSVTYDELVSASDVVSFHVPLTRETRNMYDAPQVELAKPGQLVINVSRGEVISVRALLAGLKSGKLGGAGLDVLPHEPPSEPEEIELVKQPNVVVTPHVAGSANEAEMRSTKIAADLLAEKLLRSDDTKLKAR